MSAYCQECFFNVDDADPVEFGTENFETCPDCGGELVSVNCTRCGQELCRCGELLDDEGRII